MEDRVVAFAGFDAMGGMGLSWSRVAANLGGGKKTWPGLEGGGLGEPLSRSM